MVFLALALSLWIASDTKQHLDLRVTVPADATQLEVAVGCDHAERHSARRLDPPAASQYVTFQHLHSDLYLVQAAVLHADGHVSLITREVVVTN